MNGANDTLCEVFSNTPHYRDRHTDEENIVDISSFTQLQANFSSKGFSIKHVIEGDEMYTVNGKKYSLCADRFLLTNAFTQGGIIVDSDTPVKGLCIEISPGLLAEVADVHHDPASPYPAGDFYNYLTTVNFFEHDYDAGGSELGQYLQQASTLIPAHGFAEPLSISQFFYTLAEKIVTSQQEMFRHFRSFSSVKATTKKDLLARLLKGKELMDDCFNTKIDIGTVAQHATMSEYYFLRLFKKTFDCTPYQYLIRKRLDYAADVLRTGHESVVNVAYQSGFSDIHTFSKSFKQYFGFNPSAIRERKC